MGILKNIKRYFVPSSHVKVDDETLQLAKYVLNMRKQGYDLFAIRKQLHGKGWDEKKINEAIGIAMKHMNNNKV